jgi:threonine aldolase
VLVGSGEFITRARRWRKMVGGGMRQAGIIAAAGRYALEHNVERLQDDHDHASLIAEAAAERFPGHVSQHTNMVFVDLPAEEMQALIDSLAEQHIRVRGPRWVTHLDISRADAERVAQAVRSG